MIGFLSGTLMETEADRLLLNVSGVGYELHCSQNTLKDVVGDELVRLYVHTHVREDALQLFGFSTVGEKQLFLSLIKVNGIGPKGAVNILSGAALSTIVGWINESDVKGLQSLPKVGKKTAEQMILSLKGQLVEDSTQSKIPKTNLADQIRSALVNLGYRPSDIDMISEHFSEATDVQSGVRQALQHLSRRLLGEL